MAYKVGDKVLVTLSKDEAEVYQLTTRYVSGLWRACPLNRRGELMQHKAIVLSLTGVEVQIV